jgi:hypothetical protein
MPQDLRDQRRIFSAGESEGTVWPQAKKCPSEAVARTGNDSKPAAAFRASLDVDSEDPLEPLHPTHGRHGLVAFHRALRSLRYDAITRCLKFGANTRATALLPYCLRDA